MAKIKKKNYYIQIIRALAILAVVFIHNCPSESWIIFVRPFLNFCVATFLFLSGFLTSDNINNVSGFYKKRVLRIFIPYLIWSIVCIIFSDTPIDIKTFIFKLMMGQASNIYYFIAVYIQLILITPLLLKLIKTKFWYFGFVITPIAITILTFLELNGVPFNFPYNANNCFVWLIFYYFGLCINNGVFKLKNYNYFKIYLVFILLQFLTSAFFWFKLGNTNLATTQIKITNMFTSLSLISIFISKKDYFENMINKHINKNKIIDFLILVGNYSFCIYLTHLLFMIILDRTLYKYIYPPFLTRGLLVIILEVIIIHFLFFIFKKFKLNPKILQYFGL